MSDDGRQTSPLLFPTSLSMVNLVNAVLRTASACEGSGQGVDVSGIEGVSNVISDARLMDRALRAAVGLVSGTSTDGGPVKVRMRTFQQGETVCLDLLRDGDSGPVQPSPRIEELFAALGGSIMPIDPDGTCRGLRLRFVRAETGRFSVWRGSRASSPIVFSACPARCQPAPAAGHDADSVPACPALLDSSRPCWSFDSETRGCALVRDRDACAEPCLSCPVFAMDEALVHGFPTVVMVVSSDESLLHMSRCLSIRAGYAVLPISEAARCASLAERLGPDIILLDDYLEDAEVEAVAGAIRSNPSTSLVRLLRVSSSSASADLRKPIDESTLLSAVNSVLASSREWVSRNCAFRPVVAFWTSRRETGSMLSSLVLEAGGVPVLAPGPFDLISTCEAMRPDLVILQGSYGNSDAASLAGLLSSDGRLSDVPLLLLGGESEWLRGPGAVLPGNSPAALIGITISRLLGRLESFPLPELQCGDDRARLLVQAAFLDRFGCACPESPETACSPEQTGTLRLLRRDGGVLLEMPLLSFTLPAFWDAFSSLGRTWKEGG
ncbi:hypothetical protein JW921_04605 [Candidatus Fermentibacterales bacterium]|nr:hypothetical protein [Candidatus Fermentibacterales bacterium]